MKGKTSELNRPSQNEIAKFLASTELFKKVDFAILEELAASLEVIYLGGLDTLIHQDEIGDCLYILQYGRLRASEKSPTGEEIPLGEIAPGEIVGETALLVSAPRTATVRAIRDSILLKLSQETFQNFIKKFPTAMFEVARVSIKRLLIRPDAEKMKTRIVSIAIVPAGSCKEHNQFAKKFVAGLNQIAPTLHLNSQLCDEYFGQPISQTPLQSTDSSKIVGWLQEQEAKYKYVVYETDMEWTNWTERCLRQADRILLVANFQDNPDLGEIEFQLFVRAHKILPRIELILLHNGDVTVIKNTKRWLEKRPIDSHYHLHRDSIADFKKLLRFITGTALGVVLGGGGVRGFAHIGFLQAMEELKIPIDAIGGTSSGALVSAEYALGRDAQAIRKDIGKRMINSKFDYTLPYTSLIKGKNITRELKAGLGEDIRIEDLWTRYFCVSTNISRGRGNIHKQGLLWRSVRASISLPAIFPPVVDNGDLLVDGGIVNNLPVDIMRNYMGGGGKVIIVYMLIESPNIKYDLGKDWLSGFQPVFQSLIPKKKRTTFPNIVEISLSSMVLSAKQYAQIMLKQADFCIPISVSQFGFLDYNTFNQVIDSGYKEALPLLKRHLG
jgi:predicted acylesterase/phospholipase RssA/CRP-like cAMP-binding protein